jgi:hypothetical protein
MPKENGEVDSYGDALFHTANDEWIKNIECTHHQEDYDMVQVLTKCLTTMTRSYGLLID